MTGPARHTLSADGRTLVIKRRVPGGVLTSTFHRQPHAGPFTDADIAAELSRVPVGGERQPGQRSRTRRTETRFGTVWTHLMLGPPTWWLPKLRREKDGTVMAGWLRLAVAVWLERAEEASDWQAVEGLLKILAVKDPWQAQLVYDMLIFAAAKHARKATGEESR